MQDASRVAYSRSHKCIEKVLLVGEKYTGLIIVVKRENIDRAQRLHSGLVVAIVLEFRIH